MNSSHQWHPGLVRHVPDWGMCAASVATIIWICFRTVGA